MNGSSGTSGENGSSGTSGENGSSGTSGSQGTSGTSAVGTSGTSGENGSAGTSGTSGENGSSGTSGSQGTSGSAGTSGVGTSGTSGTSISDSLTLTGTFSSTGLSEFSEVIEVINSTPTGATASNVTYDLSTGAIWYHGTASTNYTAKFVNVPTTNNRAVTATIIISQGSTGYSPTIVQIEGVTQSVKWAGGTYSVSTNKVDIIGFTFLRTSSNWTQVLGQISPFS